MDVKPSIVAVSWTMPPLVAPRSVQVARTLFGLRNSGWYPVVISQEVKHHTGFKVDRILSQETAGGYEIDYVDIGSAPLSTVLRESNFWDKNRLSVRLSHYFHVWFNKLYSIPYLCLVLPKKWILHPFPYWDLPEWRISIWRDRAINKVRDHLRQNPGAILITFAQPWVDHEIGHSVKRRNPGVKWIAHFSDPWVDSPFYSPKSGKEHQQQSKLERATVTEADALVFVTEEVADAMCRKYPHINTEKVFVIPHSMSPRFPESVPSRQSQHDVSRGFHLVHVGSLYGGRQAFNLIRAVALLRERGELAPDFRLRLVGPCDNISKLEYFVGETQLDCVELVGIVDWSESQKIIQSADALVVIEAQHEASPFLPSKFIDYLETGRPILGLTSSGSPVGKMLEKLNLPIASPNDVPEIAQGILMLTSQKYVESQNQKEVISKFSNKSVSKAWDLVLEFVQR